MSVVAVTIPGPVDARTIAALRAAVSAIGGTVVVDGGDLPAPIAPRVADVIARVAFELGLPVAAIVGPRRFKPLVRARCAVAWVAARCLDKSLPQIGRALGRRDHSSVLHQLRKADELRAHDPAFARLTTRLEALFTDGGEQ